MVRPEYQPGQIVRNWKVPAASVRWLPRKNVSCGASCSSDISSAASGVPSACGSTRAKPE